MALMGCGFSAHAELMFSQYVDGTSNRKGLEIYNPDTTVADLSQYQIKIFSNGSTTAGLTVSLEGVLPAKAEYLVGRSELQLVLGDLVKKIAGLNFNGNDAVVLYKHNTPVDRFGVLGQTTSWAEGTSLSRNKTTHSVSSVDPTAPFDVNSEWTAWSDRNAFSQYLLPEGEQPPPVTETISCSSSDTAIADLHSASKNQIYTVRGVMTADYRYSNGFSGFYLQTPDSKAKPDLNNAIFVYIPASSQIKGGQVGEEVILRGRLTSYQNQLQLDQLTQDIQTCNPQAASWVAPKTVNLPFESLTDVQQHAPQRYQGALVKLPQTLTVSENYNYGRYGELALSLGRLYMPTNLYPAKSDEALSLAKQNLLSKIILDDGYNNQNRTPWLPLNFNAQNTLRAGYELQNVEGILEYRFNQWRIQPVQGRTLPNIVADKNERSSVSAKNTAQIRAAAFNVLNYDNGAAQGFPTERGAKTKAEFDKQHQKIVSALKAIDADVYGLNEIANNGYGPDSAIAYLTQSLGPDWKYVTPPNTDRLGTDTIAVAMIYNSKRLTPVNAAAVFDDGTQLNRVTMAQSFKPVAGGESFTVVPQHLKSKGSCPDTGLDADQDDGQGCWNSTRVTAVQKLMQWLATNPTKVTQPNVLILGDLNSYAKEDPILALEKANYKNLFNDEKIGQGKQAYSYVFGVASNTQGYGGAGNLDHAIADAQLYPRVKRAFAWAINADEPTALAYNEDYKTAEQIQAFYSPDAFRSSDHDPIIIDLDLSDAPAEPKPWEDSKADTHGGSTGLWSLLGLFGLSAAAWLRRRK
ncbi:ExeM/NucH family extracellular endonuclease [Acinetobacter indicus]|uniref:ExeM/NucH family extracellular endonuclease n=1 Tax=Acinetobacter indicus TaxID=756892 RepID=UPI00144461A1|nr:ExeM/NucH family extracellular endonuclease [Acinetobacter indicus]